MSTRTSPLPCLISTAIAILLLEETCIVPSVNAAEELPPIYPNCAMVEVDEEGFIYDAEGGPGGEGGPGFEYDEGNEGYDYEYDGEEVGGQADFMYDEEEGGPPMGFAMDQIIQNWYPDNPRTDPTRTKCTDPTSNPRGRYTSHLVPCKFRFHRASRSWSPPPPFGVGMSLSDICTDDDVIPNTDMTEYVMMWQDECVGDFGRCYTVPVDEPIYLDFVCEHGWIFPDGATHMSVDCTEDKAAKATLIEQYVDSETEDDTYWKHEQESMQKNIDALEKVVFSIVTVFLLSCMICCLLGYYYVFKPYHDTMKNTLHRESLRGLINRNKNNRPEDDLNDVAINGTIIAGTAHIA